MGDISDMVLDGTLDEWTGEYLGPGPGYPRSLDPEHYSNKVHRYKDRKMNPVFGIENYLRKKGVKDFEQVTAEYQTEELRKSVKAMILHSSSSNIGLPNDYEHGKHTAANMILEEINELWSENDI